MRQNGLLVGSSLITINIKYSILMKEEEITYFCYMDSQHRPGIIQKFLPV